MISVERLSARFLRFDFQNNAPIHSALRVPVQAKASTCVTGRAGGTSPVDRNGFGRSRTFLQLIPPQARLTESVQAMGGAFGL